MTAMIYSSKKLTVMTLPVFPAKIKSVAKQNRRTVHLPAEAVRRCIQSRVLRSRCLLAAMFNPDNPLDAICYDFPASIRPELVEGFVLQRKWFDKLTTNGLMDYPG
jgi:hypothetical protein